MAPANSNHNETYEEHIRSQHLLQVSSFLAINCQPYGRNFHTWLDEQACRTRLRERILVFLTHAVSFSLQNPGYSATYNTISFINMLHQFRFFIYFLYLKILSWLMRSPCFLCVCESPNINFWILETICMKFRRHIMTYESIRTVYQVNRFHQYVFVCVSLYYC
jgi:hypothetical protein